MLTRLLMVKYLSQVLMKTSVKFNKCLVQNTNTVDEDYTQQQKHDLCLVQLKKKVWKLPLHLLEAQDANRTKEAFAVRVLQILRLN